MKFLSIKLSIIFSICSLSLTIMAAEPDPRGKDTKEWREAPKAPAKAPAKTAARDVARPAAPPGVEAARLATIPGMAAFLVCSDIAMPSHASAPTSSRVSGPFAAARAAAGASAASAAASRVEPQGRFDNKALRELFLQSCRVPSGMMPLIFGYMEEWGVDEDYKLSHERDEDFQLTKDRLVTGGLASKEYMVAKGNAFIKGPATRPLWQFATRNAPFFDKLSIGIYVCIVGTAVYTYDPSTNISKKLRFPIDLPVGSSLISMPNGRIAVATLEDNIIRIFDAADLSKAPQEIRNTNGSVVGDETEGINDIRLLGNRYLVVGLGNGLINIWDINSSLLIKTFFSPCPPKRIIPLSSKQFLVLDWQAESGIYLFDITSAGDEFTQEFSVSRCKQILARNNTEFLCLPINWNRITHWHIDNQSLPAYTYEHSDQPNDMIVLDRDYFVSSTKHEVLIWHFGESDPVYKFDGGADCLAKINDRSFMAGQNGTMCVRKFGMCGSSSCERAFYGEIPGPELMKKMMRMRMAGADIRVPPAKKAPKREEPKKS